MKPTYGKGKENGTGKKPSPPGNATCMPIDPFFTSAFPRRSARAWAEEKADPRLLKLRGKARIDKIVELERARSSHSREITDGEFWFIKSARATGGRKAKIGRREHAKAIRNQNEEQPRIFLGFNTGTR